MKKPSNLMRIVTLCVVLVLVFSLFGIRLIQFQVVEGEEYKLLANRNSTNVMTVKAVRGEILDRNGNPMAVNRMGFNVIMEKAFVPPNQENDIILKLVSLLKKNGEEWNDTMPISKTEPYTFEENREKDIQKIISELGLNVFATAENIMKAFEDKYKLSGYTPEQRRIISGVKYEMIIRGYSESVSYVFAEDVSSQTAVKIKENSVDLIGVDIIETPIREYVSGSLAPHVIGSTGPITAEQYKKLKGSGYKMNDILGQSGIEGQFEEYLKGQDGIRQIEQNMRGDVINDVLTQPPVPGNTIVLTLDKKLQEAAQRSLEQYIKNMNEKGEEKKGKDASAGAVVALDVKTGEVLALVSYPTYDLRTYKQEYSNLLKEKNNPLFDRALTARYMPGSIYKPMISLAGMAEGVTPPNDRITCSGIYNFFAPSYTPGCMGVHGNTGHIHALGVSCNIFYYETGRRLGIKNINNYASQFGLGVKTGIELYESLGVQASPEYSKKLNKPWNAGDVIQAAIGQGDNSFTPMQLAQYTATLANGGKRMEAHIVKEIKSYNFDKTIKTTEPKVLNTIETDSKYFDVVKKGMMEATKSGSGRFFLKDYPITVASKTGTPESYDKNKSNHASFIAYAPAEDPQIAIAAFVEHGDAGWRIGTIVRDVLDAYFFGEKETEKPVYNNALIP